MEARILTEVEQLINDILASRGVAFDPKRLVASCIGNVIMIVLFGRRFDHSDPDFQHILADFDALLAKLRVELDVFPILRRLPYYKKSMAELRVITERSYGILSKLIAACRQVFSPFFTNLLFNIHVIYIAHEVRESLKANGPVKSDKITRKCGKPNNRSTEKKLP